MRTPFTLLLLSFPLLAAGDGCGDLNNDGRVNFADLGIFRQQFGEVRSQIPGCRAISVSHTCESAGALEESRPIKLVVRWEGDCLIAYAEDAAGNRSTETKICNP